MPFVDFPLNNRVQAVEPSTAHSNAKRLTRKRAVSNTRLDWNDSRRNRRPPILCEIEHLHLFLAEYHRSYIDTTE